MLDEKAKKQHADQVPLIDEFLSPIDDYICATKNYFNSVC